MKEVSTYYVNVWLFLLSIFKYVEVEQFQFKLFFLSYFSKSVHNILSPIFSSYLFSCSVMILKPLEVSFEASAYKHTMKWWVRAGFFRLKWARAMKFPSRAELGHFNFQAETELTIPTIKNHKFYLTHFPPKFLLSEVLYHDFNQFHDHLSELL